MLSAMTFSTCGEAGPDSGVEWLGVDSKESVGHSLAARLGSYETRTNTQLVQDAQSHCPG